MSAEPQPLTGLLDTRGAPLETPCYVYDAARMRETFVRLREHLGTPLLVRYREQPNLDILGRLNDLLDAGFVVSSVLELQHLARSYGGARKVASSPALTPQFLLAAVASRAHVVLDGDEQLAAYRELNHSSKSMSVSLRLRPPGAGAAAENRPGIAVSDLVRVAQAAAASGIAVQGLHVSAASADFAAAGAASVEAAAQGVRALRAELAIRVERVCLGWELETRALLDADLSSYRSRVASLAREVGSVAHEVGRCAFEEGGSFAARVVHVKHGADCIVAVCDGGIAPWALASGGFRVSANSALLPGAPGRAAAQRKVLVVGASSHPRDVLAVIDRCSFEPAVGDLCVVSGCGSARTGAFSAAHAAQLAEYLV